MRHHTTQTLLSTLRRGRGASVGDDEVIYDSLLESQRAELQQPDGAGHAPLIVEVI